MVMCIYELFDIIGIGNIGDSRFYSEDSYPTVGVTMFLHGYTERRKIP